MNGTKPAFYLEFMENKLVGTIASPLDVVMEAL
jgi:hypothetical protein